MAVHSNVVLLLVLGLPFDRQLPWHKLLALSTVFHSILHLLAFYLGGRADTMPDADEAHHLFNTWSRAYGMEVSGAPRSPGHLMIHASDMPHQRQTRAVPCTTLRKQDTQHVRDTSCMPVPSAQSSAVSSHPQGGTCRSTRLGLTVLSPDAPLPPLLRGYNPHNLVEYRRHGKTTGEWCRLDAAGSHPCDVGPCGALVRASLLCRLLQDAHPHGGCHPRRRRSPRLWCSRRCRRHAACHPWRSAVASRPRAARRLWCPYDSPSSPGAAPASHSWQHWSRCCGAS